MPVTSYSRYHCQDPTCGWPECRQANDAAMNLYHPLRDIVPARTGQDCGSPRCEDAACLQERTLRAIERKRTIPPYEPGYKPFDQAICPPRNKDDPLYRPMTGDEEIKEFNKTTARLAQQRLDETLYPAPASPLTLKPNAKPISLWDVAALPNENWRIALERTRKYPNPLYRGYGPITVAEQEKLDQIKGVTPPVYIEPISGSLYRMNTTLAAMVAAVLRGE